MRSEDTARPTSSQTEKTRGVKIRSPYFFANKAACGAKILANSLLRKKSIAIQETKIRDTENNIIGKIADAVLRVSIFNISRQRTGRKKALSWIKYTARG